MQQSVVYVAGTVSGCGKSSVCQAILAYCLARGFAATDLGYIKPVTQCVEEQPVSAYCQQQSISVQGVGPVVFSAEFLAQCYQNPVAVGQQSKADVQAAIAAIGKAKRLLLVDGVGYPGVGSVIGLSNAEVAKMIGARVVCVSHKKVLGDIIDDFSYMAGYFNHHEVEVLGLVCNQVASTDQSMIQTQLSDYFTNFSDPQKQLLGVLPSLDSAVGLEDYFNLNKLETVLGSS